MRRFPAQTDIVIRRTVISCALTGVSPVTQKFLVRKKREEGCMLSPKLSSSPRVLSEENATMSTAPAYSCPQAGRTSYAPRAFMDEFRVLI